MTDYYIDPDAATNGSGTIDDPFNTWPSLDSNNNYYQKRGTVFTTTTRIDAQAKTNITLGAYGEGDLPIIETYRSSTSTGDWTEIAANIWQLDLGTEFSNSTYLFGLGELGTDENPSWTERVNYNGAGTGTSGAGAFTEFGQWDNVPGQVGTTSKLHIYADANPVTKWGDIHYLLANHETFGIRDGSTNVTIENIHFRRTSSSAKTCRGSIDTENIIIQDCIMEHCWFGVTFGGSSNDCISTIFRRNIVKRTGNVGIRIQRNVGDNCYILNNEVYRTGVAEGIGSLYGAPEVAATEKPLVIAYNIFDGVTLSPYWSNEGRPLYIENSASNTVCYANYCANAHTDQAGIHLNGGSDNVVFYGNFVENCEKGFASSDASPIQSDDFHVCNNFFNTVTGLTFGRPSALGTMTAVVRNNICVASISGSGTGINLDTDVQTLDGVDEDYNFYYDFGTTATNITIGSNSNDTDDPTVNSDGTLPSTSPCVGIGEKWWTSVNNGLWPEGYNTYPFSDIDTDIGCAQSEHSQFHPKNL